LSTKAKKVAVVGCRRETVERAARSLYIKESGCWTTLKRSAL
jgi:hypothetical protein